MLLRRWIAVLAALGMLIHTGLLVRHSGIVLESALHATEAAAEAELQAALQEAPCPMHVAGQKNTSSPGKPASTYKCPVCAGLCTAVAIADQGPGLLKPDFEVERLSGSVTLELTLGSPRLWPPNRGPPFSIA